MVTLGRLGDFLLIIWQEREVIEIIIIFLERKALVKVFGAVVNTSLGTPTARGGAGDSSPGSSPCDPAFC